MFSAISKKKEADTADQISATLDRLRTAGKSAARRTLKEIAEICNSFNSEAPRGSAMLMNPDLIREEVYRKYYAYFQSGL